MGHRSLVHGGPRSRCGAKTRAGTACQSPPVAGRKRCRLHGGLSPGAPRGSRNGNYRRGDWTTEAIEERRWLRSLVRNVCENRNRPMSKKLSAAAPSVASGKVPAPVRVRLKRVNCDQAIPYPPDGQPREWWHRLQNAFGTASSAFVGASLQQLIAAARLPNSGISEIAVNASLAFIEGAKPRERLSAPSSSKWPAPIARPWRA